MLVGVSMSVRVTAFVVALLAAFQIASAQPADDASVPAPIVDAGVPIAVDAGVPIPDAGVATPAVDAGTALDAPQQRPDRRRRRDAGVVDAGVDTEPAAPTDAGVADAGELDAGEHLDAGVAQVDAGVIVDAGVVDAGVADTKSAIVGEPAPEPIAPATAKATTESTLFAIKVIGGLIALLVVAYLGAHRRVVRFQEQLGISGVITAGFPFIALGLIAGLEPVGILSGQVLENLRPLLFFGLGWLGFIIGAQLDIRVLERVPRGTAYVIVVESLAPFAVVGVACGALMIAFGASWRDPLVWRDAILLGVAAAMTAPRKFRGFANRTWREDRGVDVLLAQLDELAGVLGLLFITAYFRPGASAWQMPSTAWLFVSLGVGVAIGVLIFTMVRLPTTNAEFFAVLLGGIALASGFAGYFDLSPIVICFIAGTLVTNFPNDQRDNIFRILRHLERPVHLLFLIITGALWTVSDWRGWVLVPVFVAARVLGKWFGIVASKRVMGARLPERFLEQRTLVAPLSALSTALVISFAISGGGSIAWVVTAVIGGSALTELLIPPTTTADAPPSRPIDELDEVDDPEQIGDDLEEESK